MGLLRWLSARLTGRSTTWPKITEAGRRNLYADFRRPTRTGRVRARGKEGSDFRFGVDAEIYKMDGIGESAKKVYVYLSKTADSEGYAFPFLKTIARRCSMSESTVRKAIIELANNGLVTKVAHRVSRKGASSNIYQVLKIGNQ